MKKLFNALFGKKDPDAVITTPVYVQNTSVPGQERIYGDLFHDYYPPIVRDIAIPVSIYIVLKAYRQKDGLYAIQRETKAYSDNSRMYSKIENISVEDIQKDVMKDRFTKEETLARLKVYDTVYKSSGFREANRQPQKKRHFTAHL